MAPADTASTLPLPRAGELLTLAVRALKSGGLAALLLVAAQMGLKASGLRGATLLSTDSPDLNVMIQGVIYDGLRLTVVFLIQGLTAGQMIAGASGRHLSAGRSLSWALETAPAMLSVALWCGLLIALGLQAGVLPGVFLLCALAMAQPAALTGEGGALTAMRASWAATRGVRLPIAVALIGVELIRQVGHNAVDPLVGQAGVGFILGQGLLDGLCDVAAIAVMTGAWVRLSARAEA